MRSPRPRPPCGWWPFLPAPSTSRLGQASKGRALSEGRRAVAGIARDRRPRAGRAGSRTPSSRPARPAPGTVRRGPREAQAGAGPRTSAAGVRPRSRSTRRATSSRSRPITGTSRTVTSTSAGSRPTSAQCRCRTSILPGSVARSDRRLQPSACSATIRSVRRSPEPPTRIGMSGPRPRIAGGLRQLCVRAGERLGARRPETPQDLDALRELIQPLARRRELQAVRGVFPGPPAGAQAAERPAAAQHVEGGDRLGEHPGRRGT